MEQMSCLLNMGNEIMYEMKLWGTQSTAHDRGWKITRWLQARFVHGGQSEDKWLMTSLVRTLFCSCLELGQVCNYDHGNTTSLWRIWFFVSLSVWNPQNGIKYVCLLCRASARMNIWMLVDFRCLVESAALNVPCQSILPTLSRFLCTLTHIIHIRHKDWLLSSTCGISLMFIS